MVDDTISPKKISVIIPAYNEAASIAGVITAARAYDAVGEIIVVDDGSEDTTAAIATAKQATVLSLQKNGGKAQAMDTGVRAARYEYICFLDADITGLTTTMLQTICAPVLRGDVDMFVGVRGRKLYIANKWIRIAPLIGGERCMTKTVWKLVPDEYKTKFQIEIALNYHTKRAGLKTGSTILHGLTQTIKEKKWGFWYGLTRRMSMNMDLISISLKLYLIASGKAFFRSKKNDHANEHTRP